MGTAGLFMNMCFLSTFLFFYLLSALKMSMSGIEVHQEVTALFNEVKLKGTHKYVTYKIERKKEIVVDIKADPNPTETIEEDEKCFKTMRDTLTKEPRYVVYDFGFTNKEGRKIKKLAFIFW